MRISLVASAKYGSVYSCVLLAALLFHVRVESNEEQKRIVLAYINQLNQARVFERPIVTQVAALSAFYQAEAYHQDYAVHHPDDSYIVTNDLPKVENLRQQFPNLYITR
jgi:peptide-methionine (S)-S-oxide reductase